MGWEDDKERKEEGKRARGQREGKSMEERTKEEGGTEERTGREKKTAQETAKEMEMEVSMFVTLSADEEPRQQHVFSIKELPAAWPLK